MFETIKRLYGKTGSAAVKKGWITEAQAEEILHGGTEEQA